ncbi:Ribosomal RNA small subunit methyltransferase I [bacterium HR21]|nr:Ribosomal RNA small subunit methyltransferase I [bacterium HR21]
MEWTPEILANKLYVVPTPIGNRGDITLRALHILRSVAVIACEDTRRTGLLLKAYGIVPRRLLRCDEHTESRCAQEVLQLLARGESVALVSDAGTPGLCDPGGELIRRVLEAGHEVSVLPGASALIPALVGSGLPSHPFLFWGFPPQRGNARHRRLAEIAACPWTSVLYEAPHRLQRLLEELHVLCSPQRRICIARELSKFHEEYLRGTVAECLQELQRRPRIRGECVVVLEGARRERDAD